MKFLNDLVFNQNGSVLTNSLLVAEKFEKRHDNIIRDIEFLKRDVLNSEEMYVAINIPDSYGRERKAYAITKDGFTLLAMGFTGKKALDFKLQYIEA